jgi:hypothetical protein
LEELEEDRGDLEALETKAAPTAILDLNGSVDGKLWLRSYYFSKQHERGTGAGGCSTAVVSITCRDSNRQLGCFTLSPNKEDDT